MEEKRDSGVMYRSFIEAGRFLTDEQRGKYYTLIFDQMFDFNIGSSDDTIVNAMFMLISPQIEANIRKYKNGMKPKKKQSISKTEAKQKQDESKTEGNVDVYDNVYDNEDLKTTDSLFEVDSLVYKYFKRFETKDGQIGSRYSQLKDYCIENGHTIDIDGGTETIEREGDIPLIRRKRIKDVDWKFVNNKVMAVNAWESKAKRDIKNPLTTLYKFIKS